MSNPHSVTDQELGVGAAKTSECEEEGSNCACTASPYYGVAYNDNSLDPGNDNSNFACDGGSCKKFGVPSYCGTSDLACRKCVKCYCK
jgi:hypothetical protein